MERAWSYLAVATVVACGLSGCHRGQQAVADAARDAEQDAPPTVTEAADTGVAPAQTTSADGGHQAAGPICAAGEVAVLLQPGEETCVVECKSASECPPGWTCNGEGVLSHNGRPGNLVHFCRSVTQGKPGTPDAGHTAPPPDAGRPPRFPGGQPAKRPELHDAGAKVK